MITMSMFETALRVAEKREADSGYVKAEKGSSWLGGGLLLLEPSETGKYYYNLQQGRTRCPPDDSLPEFLELLSTSGFKYSYTTPAENPEDNSYRFVIEKTDKVLPPTLSEVRAASQRKQKKLAEELQNTKKSQVEFLREQVGGFHVIREIQEAAIKGADAVDIQILPSDKAYLNPGYSAALFCTLQLLALEGYDVKQRGDKLTVDWSTL